MAISEVLATAPEKRETERQRDKVPEQAGDSRWTKATERSHDEGGKDQHYLGGPMPPC